MKKRLRTTSLAILLVGAIVLHLAGGLAFASEEKDYSKHLTITWAVYSDSEITNINADAFATMWGEKFNVEFEVIPMTAETWDEKVRIWANAMDLPDVTQWDYKHADGASYAEQELVAKLPDGWQDKWPNLAKAFEGTVAGPMLAEAFGGVYFLPRPIFANNKPTDILITHQGIYMRKDWVEAVGETPKDHYSVEELMDLARLIKDQDPGNIGDRLIPFGNGINELPWYFVYPVSSYSMRNFEFFKDANGQYQWGPAQPETLQGLKYYEQAYREGLIFSEFYSNTVDNFQELFYTAGITAMCQWAGMAQVALRFSNNIVNNLDLTREDLVFTFCVGDDGYYHTVEAPNFWGTLMLAPSLQKDMEKFERILDILDYSCTQEGQNGIRMGIEGTDWEFGEDGKPSILLEPGKTVLDVYYSIRPFFHNMYIVSDDFGLVNPAYPQMFRDMSYNQYQAKYSLTSSESLGRIDWDAYFFDSDAKRRTNFDLREEYAALVVADGDMEDKWNAWVEEKMRLVQPVLDELNAM